MTVLIVAGAIVLNVTSVTVNLHNVNCAPIVVAGVLPVSLPGVDFPAMVATNATESATVPPVTVTTRFRPPDVLEANLFGAPLQFHFPADVSSVTFDGIELTTGQHALDLGRGAEHDLIVKCQ